MVHRILRQRPVENTCDPAAADPEGAGARPLFTHLLTCGVHDLLRAALRNVHCPPEALAERVEQYVAHDGDGVPELSSAIRDIAANPALPEKSRQALVELVVRSFDHEVFTGLARNPTVTAEQWRELATASAQDEPHRRRTIERAGWLWSGEVFAQEEPRTPDPS